MKTPADFQTETLLEHISDEGGHNYSNLTYLKALFHQSLSLCSSIVNSLPLFLIEIQISNPVQIPHRFEDQRDGPTMIPFRKASVLSSSP